MFTRIIYSAVLVSSLVACGGSGDDSSSTNNSSDDSTGSSANNGDSTNAGDNSNSSDVTENTDNTASVEDQNPSSGTSFFGLLAISDQSGIIAGSASFEQISPEFTLADFEEQIAQNTCTSFELYGEDEDDSTNVDVSAGENIVVSSVNGTLITLGRTSFSGSIDYTGPLDIPGPLPSGVTVDIPGDQFPAFSNISVPATDRVQITSPLASEIPTLQEEIQWNQPSGEGSFINIEIEAVNATGDLVFVDCGVVDDGSFVLPESDLLSLSDFQITQLNVSRFNSQTISSGNTLFLVTNVSFDSIEN